MASLSKFLILLVTTVLAVSAYVVNTWYSWQMFKYNLNVVPAMQDNYFLGSSGFLVLMNIVSNIFNPIVCAGYIMAFYLLSHRRFQILVFLIWFIFLSVFLTFMKSLIQQARPYWIPNADVQMLEWTCYTQFGCPSGHSMLGLILIQFMVRYLNRSKKLAILPKTILIIGGVFLQFLVVFSRIILGMHSINQVMFGVMLGFYSLIPYYMYMQKFILKICLKACSKSYRKPNLIVNTLMIFVMMGLSMATTFGPQFPSNQQYYNHIHVIQRCQGVQIYSSFQYKCLIDSSLVMAVFGIMYGIIFLRNQQRLMKVVTYPRSSKKYILRLILSALLAIIPVAIFLNPFWKKIELPTEKMAVMLFFLQSGGLMGGNFVLVGLAPAILSKLKLQDYFTQEEGKKYLSYSPLNIQESTITNKQNEMETKKKLLQEYSNAQSLYVPQSSN